MSIKPTIVVCDHIHESGLEILKNTKKPLTKEEVINLVSEKRIVRESTILLNLQNKKMFLKDDSGKYKVRES